MPALLSEEPISISDAPTGSPAGPDQGVIEEARRRQRLRRIRVALLVLIVAAIIGWGLSGGASHATLTHAGVAGRPQAVDASDPHAPTFNVRLAPTLVVGQAGWCVDIEENGVTGGSACGGVPTPSRPFLQVYGWSEGGSHFGRSGAGSHLSTTVAVTIPQTAAILVDGKRRVPTQALPALPYGLRAARIVTSVKSPGPALVALDAQGHAIAQQWTNTPFQGVVHSWRSPSRPAQGSCQLHASGLPGLSARSGKVASAIRPFPGQLIGHAFLPCIATVYYMRHMPLRAMIVLDAADPRARAAALPDWKPVRRAPGFFAEGGLTAKRSGAAWLVVGQGSGLAQRMSLLRHLTPTIKL